MAIVWLVWNERNHRIFQLTERRSLELLHMINSYVSFWLSHLTGKDWMALETAGGPWSRAGIQAAAMRHGMGTAEVSSHPPAETESGAPDLVVAASGPLPLGSPSLPLGSSSLVQDTSDSDAFPLEGLVLSA